MGKLCVWKSREKRILRCLSVVLNATKESKTVKTRRRSLNKMTIMQSLSNFKDQFQRVMRVGGSLQEAKESIKEEEMEMGSFRLLEKSERM